VTHKLDTLSQLMGKKGPNAHWSLADENVLLDYLWEHRSEAGEGVSFRAPTLAGAAAKLKETTMKGGLKTGGSCKNKWGKVCCIVALEISFSDRIILQFKELYLIICDIKSQSGFSWCDKKGANIGLESASVWEAYVKVSFRHIQVQSMSLMLFQWCRIDLGSHSHT